MYVITRLEERFGREQLNRWKVLLLNAGGQSQRLPSASVLGKIFTALPIEGYQVGSAMLSAVNSCYHYFILGHVHGTGMEL